MQIDETCRGDLFRWQVELQEADILFDDFLGKKSINAANLKPGTSLQKTLSFGKVLIHKRFFNLKLYRFYHYCYIVVQY